MDNSASTILRENESSLSLGQVISMVAFGILGWFAAAMTVRFGGPAGLFEGWGHALLYVGTILFWVPAHLLLKKALRLGPAQIVPALAIGIGTAAFCDGVAMPWVTWLYQCDPSAMFRGAGWILHFVSVGLIVAYLDARRSHVPR